jgi:rRNA maturation endonuclease Nob1
MSVYYSQFLFPKVLGYSVAHSLGCRFPVKTANQIEMPCLGCGLPFHDKASLFCKICGTPLEQEPEEVL